MEHFDRAIKVRGMMFEVEQVQDSIYMLQSSTNTYAISDGLIAIPNNAVTLLDEEAKKKHADLTRSGKANRITRAHEETFGNIWCVLGNQDIPSCRYREYFTRRAAEFKGSTEYALRVFRSFTAGPFWSQKLPVLTALAFFRFVVYTEVWYITTTVTEQEVGKVEETIYSALDSLTEENFEENMASFMEMFNNFYTKSHLKIAALWDKSILSSSDNTLTVQFKGGMERSLEFLRECDHIFPYGNYRNKPFIDAIKTGWTKSIGGTSARPKLKAPVGGQDIYTFYSPRWSNMLDLLTPHCDDSRLATLKAGYPISKEISSGYEKTSEVPLSYCGFTGATSGTAGFKAILQLSGSPCLKQLDL